MVERNMTHMFPGTRHPKERGKYEKGKRKQAKQYNRHDGSIIREMK